MRWNFSIDNLTEEQPHAPLPLPDKVDLELFEYGPYRKIWSMRGLSVKEWINHFTNIFHLPTVCSITFEENANTFDIEEIRDTFKSVDTLSFGNSDGTDVESIIKHFPTRELYFGQGASNTLKHPQKVLIQNFDQLCLTYKHAGIALTLDDLLMTNSKRVSLIGLEWTGKQVNRFIKHWMRGSNPRMEDIFIGFMPFFTVNQLDILKGIKYMELPKTQLRWFKKEGRRTQQVEGGIDIYRRDGTRATIKIRQNEPLTSFHLFVWHPHCIGDPEY
ncbi:CRE-FBXB-115 protein [Caenorhabditis remanei]|uniref:CRE-FBXB-115 protein n=1 Tax=Caenorhabditis remanei TaxID=31234 RepID=E3NCT7_CAERE|nr:CRE-FBXB-115 protein [Caenorhabditis remanei]